VLESLTLQKATGVLAVDGNPAGAIYFDQGQISFARSSWTPDLAARLRGAVPPTAELRDLLGGQNRAGDDIEAILVQKRYITRDRLRTIVTSVVVDAVIALTHPLPGESALSDIRFEAPGDQWAGTPSRLGTDAVRAEAGRRAARMTRAGLSPAAPVRLCDLDRPWATIQRDQWAVACLIADGLSAIDLAWQHGLALYEALASLGDLIRAGACAPCGPHPSVLAIAPSAGPDLAGADPRKAPESPAISRAVAEILASQQSQAVVESQASEDDRAAPAGEQGAGAGEARVGAGSLARRRSQTAGESRVGEPSGTGREGPVVGEDRAGPAGLARRRRRTAGESGVGEASRAGEEGPVGGEDRVGAEASAGTGSAGLVDRPRRPKRSGQVAPTGAGLLAAPHGATAQLTETDAPATPQVIHPVPADIDELARPPEPHDGPSFTPPPPELLRRVLGGLRKLS
jgi:hypothetical protein